MVRLKQFFLAFFLLLVGFIAGALFQRYVQVGGLLASLGLRQPFNVPSTSDLPLPSAQLPDLTNDAQAFIGLVLGQSNAGSHGSPFVSQDTPQNSYQFWQGSVYAAVDPLYGSTGNGGSIWMQLSPQLLNDHPAVVWAATVVDATIIADWIPGGTYHRYLTDTLDAIEAESLPVDAVFWIQGSRDAVIAKPEEEYFQALQELIRILQNSLTDTPIYLAKATRCYELEPYMPVRNAVDRAIAEFDGVYAGIDLDRLGLAYRFDGCHLTRDGQTKAAQQWYEVLGSNPDVIK